MPGRGMNLLKERIRMENMLDFPMMHVCLRLPTERDVGRDGLDPQELYQQNHALSVRGKDVWDWPEGSSRADTY